MKSGLSIGGFREVEMLAVAVPARYGYRSPSDVRVIESGPSYSIDKTR